MAIFKLMIHLCAILLLIGSGAVIAQPPLASALQDGQHILLMRHADAPGFGDPPNYQLDQCNTQRNLGELGRKQAKATGDWLSKQGIKQAQVFSSPWCRCIDTALLLDKGNVAIEPALGSFFDNTSQADVQTKNLIALIAKERQKNPQSPIIMVTHQVNIGAFIGQAVGSGEMILVKVDPQGRYLNHQHYPSP
jgi:broad specificity phosphatase PhoE